MATAGHAMEDVPLVKDLWPSLVVEAQTVGLRDRNCAQLAQRTAKPVGKALHLRVSYRGRVAVDDGRQRCPCRDRTE